MADSFLEELDNAIAGKHAVLLVGAGVSTGATNGAAVASWTGLLHHGVDRCVQVAGATLRAGWADQVHADVDSTDLDDLLSAAEKVSSKLGAPSGGDFFAWLQDTVGALTVADRTVIEALHALGLPMATTNYDSLLEEVTRLEAVTWRQGALREQLLRGDERGILHLHGYWREPESVILGIRSYERVLADAHAQAMLRALGATRTLIFVGFGAGLSDPNFAALRAWSREVFAGSTYHHFRLCRACEEDAVRKEHYRDERIVPVVYGAEHGELAPFLRERAARAAAAPSAVAPAIAAPPAPAALPPAPHCFGRDDEVAAVVEALLAGAGEPLAVLGGPGVGKTTVVLTALRHKAVAARYGARRYFVRCDAIRNAEAFGAEIGRAVSLELGPDLDVRLRAFLAKADTALVLDNAEDPLDADTLGVENLFDTLAGLDTVALIATIRSQERPGGVAPWREPIRLGPLAIEPARKAFLAVAGVRYAGDADLDALLNAVDRLPIAVNLLAYAAQGEPNLAGVRARWLTERSAMLTRAGGRDRLTNVDLSYEISIMGPRMTDEARWLLSTLAFLPEGLPHPDLIALFSAFSSAAAHTLRSVRLAYDTDAGRLRLLAPLREHAAKHLPARPEDLDILECHYFELAKLGKKVGSEGGAEAARRLAEEVPNIEALIRVALAEPDPIPAARAAIALTNFIRFTGLSGPGLLNEVEAILGRMDDPELLGDCIFALGLIALDRSEHGEAHTRFEDALPLYRGVGSVLGEANCMQSLGDIALERLKHDEARARFEEALPLYQRVGSVLGEANCIQGLGNMALARSDHGGARARFEEALPLYRRVDDVLGEANCIYCLGDIALARSDHDGARARYEKALPPYRRVGNVLGGANCIRGLGDIALERSDRDGARERFEEALELYGRIPEPYSIGGTYRRLARIARDDTERADYVAKAREAWAGIDRPDLIAKLDDEFG